MNRQGRLHAHIEMHTGLSERLDGTGEGIDVGGRELGQSVDARRERISLVVQAVIP